MNIVSVLYLLYNNIEYVVIGAFLAGLVGLYFMWVHGPYKKGVATIGERNQYTKGANLAVNHNYGQESYWERPHYMPGRITIMVGKLILLALVVAFLYAMYYMLTSDTTQINVFVDIANWGKHAFDPAGCDAVRYLSGACK